MSFPFDLHSAAVSDSHLPCRAHAVLLKATAQHGRLSTAVLCCGLEKNGKIRAWHGRGMASVNQTRPHCVNQMGKTHSKPLAPRHGRGMAWVRHVMCESAIKLQDGYQTHPIRLSQDEDLLDDGCTVVVGEPRSAREVSEISPGEAELKHFCDKVNCHDENHKQRIAQVQEVAPAVFVLPVMVPKTHQMHDLHVDRQEVMVHWMVRRLKI